MAGLIGALRVTLGLDSAQFEAGTKRARAVAKRDVGEIQRIANGAKTALAGMISAATITAFAGAAKRALDFAGGLGELAQQAGISTKALQEYSAIGVDVGLTNDDIVSSFARLSKTIGSAQDGNKKAAETFRQLGIDVTGLTAEDAMPKLIAAFERIKSPTDQARIASELFGRTAGAKLLPLLNMTAQGFEEARQAAHDFGLVLSDEAIDSADAASDAISKLTKVVEVSFAAAMAGGADGVAAMAGELSRMVAALPGQINSIRQFAFSAAEALRVIGPYGDFVANQAKRAAATGLSNKDFAKASRDAAKRLKDNPNDPEAQAFANFLLTQGKARLASANARSVSAASAGGSLVPRTDRGGGGGGKKGGGGGARDRSAEYLERFNREMASLEDEQLRHQQGITTDVRERARLEHLRIETEEAAYNIDVETRQKAGELTKAQAEQLRLQYAANAQKQHTLVNWQLDDELTEQELDLKRSAIDIDSTMLNIQLDAARTQEDRRRIQLRILDNEIELERAALEAVKAKHKTNEVEYQIADAKLKQLDEERAGRVDAIRRSTMGPLERYIDELPKGAKELNEAYQQVAVDGLQSLNDGLAEAILQSKSLGDVVKNVANQIIADLARIAVQQLITKPLAEALFGVGGGLGGLFGGSQGIAAGDGANGLGDFLKGVKIPGLATGGSFMVGGRAGTDRNVLAINGIPRVRVSADERINVTRAGQDNRPIIVQVVGEEGAAFVPRVTQISGAQTAQVVTGVARRNGRSNRARLA